MTAHFLSAVQNLITDNKPKTTKYVWMSWEKAQSLTQAQRDYYAFHGMEVAIDINANDPVKENNSEWDERTWGRKDGTDRWGE